MLQDVKRELAAVADPLELRHLYDFQSDDQAFHYLLDLHSMVKELYTWNARYYLQLQRILSIMWGHVHAGNWRTYRADDYLSQLYEGFSNTSDCM